MGRSYRVFIAEAAFLSQPVRCSSLLGLIQALDFELLLLRGSLAASEQELLARAQQIDGCTVSEECFPTRLSFRYRTANPSLLVVQRGRCILEMPSLSSPACYLKVQGHNAALLPAGVHDITFTQAPLRLVRFLLPPGSVFDLGSGAALNHGGSISVDLSLLMPLQRLLEQSLRHGAPVSTRLELGQTLLDYVRHQFESAGCSISLPSPSPIPTDPLQALEHWLQTRLDQPLQLSDLARAAALSPRRLQEICRERLDCSPMDWLRSLRLESFAAALVDPARLDQSVGVLLRHFQLPASVATRRAFTKRFGCSPSDYRRSQLLHQ